MRVVLLFMSAILVVLSLIGCGSNASTNSQPTTTVMTYVIGSDLQCKSNLAQLNIGEMQEVGTGNGLNIITQTGGVGTLGCDGSWGDGYWQGYTEVNRSVQYNGRQEVVQNLGSTAKVDMGHAQTLEDFIVWAKATYPADKYVLVLWSHSGGINNGLGPDQNTSNSISMPDLIGAVKNSGVSFELIAFDSCLNGMAEIAAGLSPYTKYFVGSQDYQPGAGMNYASFLQYIKNNPNASGADIGKAMVDSFIAKALLYNTLATATLSVIDTSKISAMMAAIDKLSVSLTSYIQDGISNWINLAQARLGALDFASFIIPGNQTPFDYVDLKGFLQNIANTALDSGVRSQADSALQAVASAIVYSRSTGGDINATGLSIFFPLSVANYASGSYDANTSINAVSFFAKNYSGHNGLVQAYYDYYNSNSSSINANITAGGVKSGVYTWNTSGNIISSNIYAGVANGETTTYFANQTVSVSNNHIIYDSSSVQASNWFLLNGEPVLLFPSQNINNSAMGIVYVLPYNPSYPGTTNEPHNADSIAYLAIGKNSSGNLVIFGQVNKYLNEVTPFGQDNKQPTQILPKALEVNGSTTTLVDIAASGAIMIPANATITKGSYSTPTAHGASVVDFSGKISFGASQ